MSVSEHDIDAFSYAKKYNISPNNLKTLYLAKYKLVNLSRIEIDDDFFVMDIFDGMLYEISNIVKKYKVTELEAKYMFILLGMDYMLNLKLTKPVKSWITGKHNVPTFKELLVILIAITETGIMHDNDYIENLEDQIWFFLKLDIRPDIIYMVVSILEPYILEITQSFLEVYKEYLIEVENYLKDKGYLEQFEEYIKN